MPRNDGMPKTSQVSVQDVTVISSWASFSFLNIYRISWNLSLAVRAAVIRRSTRLLWMLAFEVKSRLRLTISRPSLSGWRSPAWCLTSMPLDTSAKASTRGGGRQAARFISPSLLEYRPAPLKFRDRPICSSPAQCVYIYFKKSTFWTVPWYVYAFVRLSVWAFVCVRVCALYLCATQRKCDFTLIIL